MAHRFQVQISKAKYRVCFTIALIVFISDASAQGDIRSYTLQHVVTLNNLNPDSTNYNDLEEIGRSIGEARVVMLGEQDHGDAPAFLAKTRLIKYLHEKMGFDVLVFEGDFWALNQYWDNIPANGFEIDSIRKNIYTIWSFCAQVQPLFGYIEACLHTQEPLIISGMDCRHSSSSSRTIYVSGFNREVLQKSSLKNDTPVLNRFRAILQTYLNKEYSAHITLQDERFFLSVLDTLKMHPALDKFWLQELQNLREGFMNAWKGNPRAAIRDLQMANNLSWLYRVKYPGKKIIVWAHSWHIARNLPGGTKKPNPNNQTAGDVISRELGDTVYQLGFTSYTGTTGRIGAKKYALGFPRGECFKNWVHSRNIEYGFIDFRNYRGNDLFRMAGTSHWDMKAQWANIFDGVIYIKNMYPCDKVVKR